MILNRIHALVLSIALIGAMPALAQTPKVKKPFKFPEVTAEQVAQITAAIPEKPRAEPARARKLLVYWHMVGFQHGATAHGVRALEIMGQKTGAFTATSVDNVANLEPASLAGYDAICIANSTGDFFKPRDLGELPAEAQKAALEREEALKAALLEFVRGGGGLVGVHAATDAYYKWAEYGEMMGGYFNGHPWNEEVTIEVVDPSHPLSAAFGGAPLVVKDEIYQFKEPYSRDSLRVLLRLDTTKTDMEKGDKIKRTDGDFAVTWLREYGQGRVFFCSLGHWPEIFMHPAILQHYLDGIQYAMGDLKADATPSAKLDPAYFEKARQQSQAGALDAAWAALPTLKTGEQADGLRLINDAVTRSHADPASRADLLGRLNGVLKADGLTSPAALFVCQQLYLIGGDESAPALGALLDKPELAGAALYALERMPGEAAAAALRGALGRTDGAIRIGIVNAIGRRRDAGAIDQLALMVKDPDVPTGCAAARALGGIGSPAAIERLKTVMHEASPVVITAAIDTLIVAGDVAYCELVYRDEDDTPGWMRGATLLAVAGARQDPALAIEGLKSGDRDVRFAGAEAARRMTAPAATAALAGALGELSTESQTMLLAALMDRGDRAAAPACLALATAPDPAVRQMAIAAAGALGDASAIGPLATLAANKETADAARQALFALRGEGVDAAMMAQLATAEPAARAELARALGARGADQAAPALLQAAADESDAVRLEAIKALGALAAPETYEPLVGVLAAAKTGAERAEAEKVVVALGRAVEPAARRGAPVIAALGGEVTPEARASLLMVLGRLGDPAGLPLLEAAIRGEDAEARKAALRALGEWPDDAPLALLRETAAGAADEPSRVLATRAFTALLVRPGDRPAGETLAQFEEAMKLAQRDEERRLLLGELKRFEDPRALALAEQYLDHPTLKAEALQSAAAIYHALRAAKWKVTASPAPENAKSAVDGDRKTRWTTKVAQAPGQAFEIDLGAAREIREIVLDAGDTGADFPRQYEVYVAAEPAQWGQPAATGKSDARATTITLPAGVSGRHIRIVQTGSHPRNFWSICELTINGQAAGKTAEKPLDPKKWTAGASVKTEDAALAIDGDLTTRWGAGGKQQPGQWFTLDLGAEVRVTRIVLDAAKSRADSPRGYEVYVSRDGQDWGFPVAVGAGGDTPKTTIAVYPRPGRYLKIVQTGKDAKNWWSIYEMQVMAE